MEFYHLNVPCKIGAKVQVRFAWDFSWEKPHECEVIRYEIQKFDKVKVVLKYFSRDRYKTYTLPLEEFCKRIEGK